MKEIDRSLTEKIREVLPTPRTLPGHIARVAAEKCLDGAELAGLYINNSDARLSEPPLVATIPATILMYGALYGIMYPVGRIISAKDFLARKFNDSRTLGKKGPRAKLPPGSF
ncbi:MAG TPA: hypothetical protein VFA93_02615 [Patescibacteria group bacterium]|nr:hypothetical protein [Patescibacteria group bacterium]